MSKIFVPSLSEDGWVTGTRRKLDKLFSHFFASDYSQTYLYIGHVASFAKIQQENQGNYTNMVNATQQALEEYLKRYFDESIVECRDISDTSKDPNIGAMTLFIEVTDNNEKVSLGKSLRFTNMEVLDIINFNNTGEL